MISAADNLASARQPAVVLVADRTLASEYHILFEGMFATMQTTHVPWAVLRGLLARPIRTDPAGRAASGALGLRRIEAALQDRLDLTPAEIAVTTPEALGKLLGPWTRLVAFSSSDPLGGGMSNTTTTQFWPGELYSKFWSRKLLQQIKRAKDRWGFTVLAGGGGAWQLSRDRDAAEALGIDCVFEGYFERQGPNLVADILAGRTPPDRVVETTTAVEQICPIRGATTMGIVELTRGCGKGCAFCTSGRDRLASVPVETILADLATNVAAGYRAVVSGSEDFFRYGAAGSTVNFPALRELLVRMNEVPGLGFMQIDHANLSSVAQLDGEQLSEIRRLITWDSPCEHLWVNLGLESANGRLVARHGPGKIAPFRPDDWPDLVEQTCRRLTESGFFPVLSVILGLPGESPRDVRDTLALVRRLTEGPSVVFPVFYEPPEPGPAGEAKRFTLEEMTADHLDLLVTCYEQNFRWVPRLVADNQRAAGVRWARRAMLQAMGRGEIITWRRTFARLGRQIAARASAGAASEGGRA